MNDGVGDRRTMTYFSFLFYFLVAPIIVLAMVALVDRRRAPDDRLPDVLIECL